MDYWRLRFSITWETTPGEIRFWYTEWECTWKNRPLHNALSATVRRHQPINQETNKTVNFLTIMPNNPLAKYMLSNITVLNSSGLVIFVSTLGIFQIWAQDLFHQIGKWDRYLDNLGSLCHWTSTQKRGWLSYLLEWFIKLPKGCCYDTYWKLAGLNLKYRWFFYSTSISIDKG